MIVLAALLGTQAGCGTACNLWAPPEGIPCIGPSTCFPLGGATRSALLGGFGTVAGSYGIVQGECELLSGRSEGFQTIGTGLGYTGIGIVSLIDTPVSLAGDVLTSPIAFARQQKAPWATWWGEKSIEIRESYPSSTPLPPERGEEEMAEDELTDKSTTDSPTPAPIVYP
jgi:hypothetical protein